MIRSAVLEGPWRVVHWKISGVDNFLVYTDRGDDDDDIRIATSGSDLGVRDRLAAARMIAAAPAMLSALQTLIDIAETQACEGDAWDEAIRKAEDATRSARGES